MPCWSHVAAVWRVEHLVLWRVEQLVLSAAAAACLSQEVDWSRPTAFVLGNEQQGVSDAALQLADHTAVIPMAGEGCLRCAALCNAAGTTIANRRTPLLTRCDLRPLLCARRHGGVVQHLCRRIAHHV
jgi:tRNA(Leu) C34 or U34 (ribose-2'-O)-methylase TrmL